jgi:hypothetical protein
MYHLLYHAKIYTLPTECICVFRMVLNNKQRVSLNSINQLGFVAET